MRKKIIAALVCLALIACCCVWLAACNKEVDQYYWGEGTEVSSAESDKTKIVFLGDSIAEGIIGASPISLRHEYAYANLIGRQNDYTYVNHSVSGHLTEDMLELISNEEGYDGARMLISNIKTADIIHVSIIGNDVLQDRTDVKGMTVHEVIMAAVEGDYSTLEYALGLDGNDYSNSSYNNIIKIVERLRKLNSDAVIIFQEVYNPIMDVDTPLIEDETREAIAEAKGADWITLENLHALGDTIIGKMNQVIKNVVSCFNDQGDNNIYSIDALAAFNKIYENNKDIAKELIYPDGIHPSNYGHAILAELTQEFLEYLKFANESTALANYKQMRIDLLNNNFAGKTLNDSVSKDTVISKINSATSYREVTTIFFEATLGVTPDYSTDVSAVVTPSELVETFFAIDRYNTSIMGVDGIIYLIEGIIGQELLDYATSGIYLRNDGTMALRLVLADGAISALLSQISGLMKLVGGGSYILDDTTTISTSTIFEKYLNQMAPGISDDIYSLLDLAYSTFGLSLVGVDENSDFVTSLLSMLKEGEISLSLLEQIPSGFGIELNYTYTMKYVSDTAGNVYTGIYLTPYDSNTQPFLVMTLEEQTYEKTIGSTQYNLKNAITVNTVSFIVDFIGLKFVAAEYSTTLFYQVSS